jgi:hypothetical protein
MENFGCFAFLALMGGLIVFVIWGMAQGRAAARKELEQAYANYQWALDALKKDPTDPNKKQKALEVGRAYSTLTREQKLITIFDEIALGNDISAATAGATKATAGISVEQRIRALEDLRTKGLISDTKYIQKRQKLVDEM